MPPVGGALQIGIAVGIDLDLNRHHRSFAAQRGQVIRNLAPGDTGIRVTDVHELRYLGRGMGWGGAEHGRGGKGDGPVPVSTQSVLSLKFFDMAMSRTREG